MGVKERAKWRLGQGDVRSEAWLRHKCSTASITLPLSVLHGKLHLFDHSCDHCSTNWAITQPLFHPFPYLCPQAENPASAAAACSSKRSCVSSYPTRFSGGLLWVWADASPSAEMESTATPLPIPEPLQKFMDAGVKGHGEGGNGGGVQLFQQGEAPTCNGHTYVVRLDQHSQSILIRMVLVGAD